MNGKLKWKVYNMNGKLKWNKPNGPAFDTGQEWIMISGGGSCWIDRVVKYGDGKFDYQIHYHFSNGECSSKDGWSFQVRYMHEQTKIFNMQTFTKIIPLVFYISGSICFLVGSVIQMLRVISGK